MNDASSVATIAHPGSEQEFRSSTVEVDGFCVEYFEAGTGDPLVVLHGAGGPVLTPALHNLAAAHRVLVIQMPGFGAQLNDRHQTFAELAETVAQVVEALGYENYHLLGSSIGGAVALQIALAHPERLLSMVLEGPAAFRVGAFDPQSAPSVDDLQRRFRAQPDREPAWQPGDPAVMARTWPLVERLMSNAETEDADLTRRLPDCAVRTLVIFGDRDGIIPPENGRTYRRLMPNCSLILVHRAAHDIQSDRPEAFSELVGEFLQRGWHFLLPDASTLINP
ncbi:alpha/beta fold hydrolase [Mycolicibacterium sp. CBM1]